MFDDNFQFRLFSNTVLFIEEDWPYTPKDLPFEAAGMRKYNRIICNAPDLPADDISSKFKPALQDNDRVIQITSLQPNFLRIKVSTSGPDISQLRELLLEAPEALFDADSGLQRTIQSATYRLCAVVNTGQGAHDRKGIRTYIADGTEMVPAEIGNYEKKEPEAADPELYRWSVQNPGVYILFDFREYVPPGWPESDAKLDAPEFEDRDWVNRSMNSQ